METKTYLGIIMSLWNKIARMFEHKRSCDLLQANLVCSIFPLSSIQNIIKEGGKLILLGTAKHMVVQRRQAKQVTRYRGANTV
jgi:hypothetical protein